MATCLITGSTGYIGSQLTRMLLIQGHTVIACAREGSSLSLLPIKKSALIIEHYETSYNSLLKIFKKYTIDIVFHLAAHSVNGHSPEDIKKILEANIILGSYLLEAMTESGCSLLINTGSYFETGESATYNPQSFYAASKHCFQHIINYYTNIKKINAISLRLMDTYGNEDTRAKLWPQLVTSFKNKTPISLSKGEQLVDLVHIDDVCLAFIAAWQLLKNTQTIEHKVYYVSSQKKRTLKTIVGVFENIAGQKLPISWGDRPYREGEIMDPYIGDILPNWQPTIDIKNGFRSLLKMDKKYE